MPCNGSLIHKRDLLYQIKTMWR